MKIGGEGDTRDRCERASAGCACAGIHVAARATDAVDRSSTRSPSRSEDGRSSRSNARADRAVARPVVIPGQEPNAFRGRHVLPITTAFSNDRERLVGSEFQTPMSGCRPADRARRRFRLRPLISRPKPIRVVYRNRCGSVSLRFRQIFDSREAQIPPLVQRRRLRVDQSASIGARTRIST